MCGFSTGFQGHALVFQLMASTAFIRAEGHSVVHMGIFFRRAHRRVNCKIPMSITPRACR
jgi:hypothetical protein